MTESRGEPPDSLGREAAEVSRAVGNERFQSRLKSGQWGEKKRGGEGGGTDGWSGGWKRQSDRIVRDEIIQQVNGGRRKGEGQLHHAEFV